jgi:hypothetical protein
VSRGGKIKIREKYNKVAGLSVDWVLKLNLEDDSG